MGRGSKMLKDTALTYCLFYLMTLSAEIIRRWQMKCEKGTGVRTTREIISTRGKKKLIPDPRKRLTFLKAHNWQRDTALGFFFSHNKTSELNIVLSGCHFQISGSRRVTWSSSIREPTILDRLVNLTYIWRFLLGTYEPTHISARQETQQ